MTFAGWVAVLAGWYTTEVGRQPWLATGVLRTRTRLRWVRTHDRHHARDVCALYASFSWRTSRSVYLAGKASPIRGASWRCSMHELSQPGGWLPLVFMALMGMAMLIYVVLDGYDLGLGILLGFANEGREGHDGRIDRTVLDANETGWSSA